MAGQPQPAYSAVALGPAAKREGAVGSRDLVPFGWFFHVVVREHIDVIRVQLAKDLPQLDFRIPCGASLELDTDDQLMPPRTETGDGPAQGVRLTTPVEEVDPAVQGV